MVVPGYYFGTVFEALFGLGLLTFSTYRLYLFFDLYRKALAVPARRDYRPSLSSRPPDPGPVLIGRAWLFITVCVAVYAVLTVADSVDSEGVYGIYSQETGYALRIFGTEVIIPASLALMLVFLITGYSIQDQHPHWTVIAGFLVAGGAKFVVGCWLAFYFLKNPQPAVLAANDWTVFGCFCLSMCLFLYFLGRILYVVSTHVNQLRLIPNSDVKPLRKTMLRFQLLIVAVVLCLVGGASVLFYDAYTHQLETELKPHDPDSYTFVPSLWCKLVWTCFVLHLVPNARSKPSLPPEPGGVSADTTKKPSSDSADLIPPQELRDQSATQLRDASTAELPEEP